MYCWLTTGGTKSQNNQKVLSATNNNCITILGKDGKLLETIYNEKREIHKYFYSKPEDSKSLRNNKVIFMPV